MIRAVSEIAGHCRPGWARPLVTMGAALAAEKDTQPPEIPTCDKKIGTLAVTEPENHWWDRSQSRVTRRP